MAREIPQPVTLAEMRQEGAQGGAEIADALMDLLASASDFSTVDLEPELRERFAAWMRAMGQLFATDKNLSSLHLKVWSEAAEAALEERLSVYRNIVAAGRTSDQSGINAGSALQQPSEPTSADNADLHHGGTDHEGKPLRLREE